MYLDHFTVQNFRNLKKLDVNFDSNVNIFIGKNAQGKTNLLEAIYFLALTRSHRTNNDKDLIDVFERALSSYDSSVMSQQQVKL